ncbi:histidinol-phosphate transaminase [Meiothermus sp. CFH 77666]|uniref:pyridoxal phosphate-dependent aminotransferase n=1 Tax=Meiothermus sp. CFH 77666 TaxID=2817942 RepID=UPI001AA0A4C0|nr:histidinol-phosphate transaminase [Meiothermus sp. CFH 77666]MBO1437337.1 histidinol-phosphate aminotransferase family protein [Meiothermus sp. CFH 77666]
MIDDVLKPIHGGTDSGPPPRFDFSTNANALGPDPHALAAIQAADPSRYPDPLYTELHQALAAHHGVSPEQIAVGGGTSELIHRLTRWRYLRGPMLILPPTFSEYARAAQPSELPLLQASSPSEFLHLLPRATLAFLCVPNNPTGEVYGFLGEAAAIAQRHPVTLVLDLAYYPLSQKPPPLPPTAWQLHSPNKAHGLTGVRAGYLVAPVDLTHLRHIAPSWVLGVHGEAMLRAVIQRPSLDWVAHTREELWGLRSALAAGLRDLGLEVRESVANFLMVRVGQATAVAQALRARGLRVRDCTSFGLPEWLRLSAQRPEAQAELLLALEEILHGQG